mgnify:CR=1 FL=1
MVDLPDFLEATIKLLDRAIDLGRMRRGQAVFDSECRAKRVKLMFASCGPLAKAKQPIDEFFFTIAHQGANADLSDTP